LTDLPLYGNITTLYVLLAYNRMIQGYKYASLLLLASLMKEGGAIMYAIIETGGKQVLCEVGSTIFVEKLDVQEGEQVVFDKVVCYSNRTTKVGAPYVKGAKVTAKVEKQGKAKKITIYKYKCKDGSSHRKQGHRQPYTKLTIEAIEA